MQGSSRQCLRRLLLAALDGGGTALPAGARTSLSAAPALLLDACTPATPPQSHHWLLQRGLAPAGRPFSCSALGLDAATAVPSAAVDFGAYVLYHRRQSTARVPGPRMPLEERQLRLGIALTPKRKSGGQDLEAALPVVAYLAFNLGFTPDELRVMCLRFPRLLLDYKVERISALVSFLKGLGLDRPEVRRVMIRFPIIATISVEKLGRRVRWLMEQGLSEAQVRGTILRYPQLISFSIPDNLEVTKALLCEELGCGQASFARLLVSNPIALGYSAARMRLNADTAAQVLQLNAARLTKLFSACPTLLCRDLSAPTYAAKREFLAEGLGLEEVGPAVLANPMYFTYGLERIVHRGLYLKSKGRPIQSAGGGTGSWLNNSEANFLKYAGDEDGAAFAAFKAALPGTPEGQRWREPLAQAAARRVRYT